MTDALQPTSRLPHPLPPCTHETMASYIRRLSRHAHLSERRILEMLGRRSDMVPSWPYVNADFMTRLATLARQPEANLRTRLTEWGEGVRPPGMPGPILYTSTASKGCGRCIRGRGGALLTEEVTQFDLICRTHRTWNMTDSRLIPAGDIAPRIAVKGQRSFQRAKKRRGPRQAGDALDTAHDHFRLLVHQPIRRIPALSETWNGRLATTRSGSASVLEVCFPEIMILATLLLGSRCLDAVVELATTAAVIGLQGDAEIPAFDQMGAELMRHCPAAMTSDQRQAARLVKGASLDYVANSCAISPRRVWSSDELLGMAAILRNDPGYVPQSLRTAPGNRVIDAVLPRT